MCSGRCCGFDRSSAVHLRELIQLLKGSDSSEGNDTMLKYINEFYFANDELYA